MNKQLLHLGKIGEKPSRLVIGLMSGTSLDGLDIAVCECGEQSLKVLHFRTEDYGSVLRARLRSIQSKEMVNLSEVCRLNTEMAHLYADWTLEALKDWGYAPEDIDLIGSHGQTIYHAPEHSQISTFQIVDGDHIAQKSGIITISDFRQKHTAAGGQGAPIAEMMDRRLFRHQTKHRVLLNLGGIANFTWLPSLESGEDIASSDTGPANTLINEAMTKYYGTSYDKDGRVAASGTVSETLLKALMDKEYFEKPFPKTTGQEDFNLQNVEDILRNSGLELFNSDLVATLTEFTVQSVALALTKMSGTKEFELYVSGGGIHNKIMMDGLSGALPMAKMFSFEDLGIHPDAKEAALMAFLANELVLGHTFEVNGEQIGLGKISLPG